MTTQTDAASLLVVDDDRIILESLSEFLRMEGYETASAGTLTEALAILERQPIDLLLTDVNMAGGDGFELLHIVRKRWPETVVMMMTAYGTIESAVEAIKIGAYDYLTKPIIDDELKLGVQRALAQQMLLRENRELKRKLDLRFGLDALIGHDPRMLKTFDLIEAVADSGATLLIQGPSGTGKSLVAHVIHQRSHRASKPFVEVSCGAIPESLLESELFGHVRGAFTGAVANKEGKFKAADAGTIFLDEIATASPALQVKLLRVLQTQQFEPVGSNKTEKVDVRVIVASNVDLLQEVESGRFRQDLYYRVNVVTIDMPPLGERAADVPALAQHFLQRFTVENHRKILGFDHQAIQALCQYHWPGNVRELENVVERAIILARGLYITVEDLPQRVVSQETTDQPSYTYRPMSLKQALAEPERRILEAALRANGWNRQITAEQLGIDRTTLYKKMKRYGMLNVPMHAGA